MAQFDPAFIEEVRSKSDIIDVVGEYVKLERRGKDYLGLCPFHSEKTPSFSVAPQKQFFYCFGCQAAGDVFKFISLRDALSYPEAVVHLARRARIPLPVQERTPAEEKAFQEKDQLLAALETGARFFQHQLLHNPDGQRALAYLTGRGLSPETIRKFRLGHAPAGWDGLLKALRSRFPEEILLKAGLVSARDGGDGCYDRFRDRLMFPIADVRGRVIGFGGRVLESGASGAKYLNSPETALFAKRRNLYALHLAKEAMRTKGEAVIVEGYMDVIACHQAGITHAVASLGTALAAEQAQLLRQQAREAVIAYDADAAGQGATLRGLDVLAAAGCEVRVLQFPEGKDPDDFIRSRGPQAFQELTGRALPLIEFKLQLARERHPGPGAEAKAAVVREIIPILVQIPDAVRRDEYLRRLAEQIDVAEEALRLDVKRHAAGGQRNSPRNNWHNNKGFAAMQELPTAESAAARAGANTRDPIWQAEYKLLQLLLLEPQLAGRALSSLGPRPFEDPLHAAVARTVQAALAAGVAGGSDGFAAQVAQRLDDDLAIKLVGELTVGGPLVLNPAQEADDCISTIKKHRDQRRSDELRDAMRADEAAGRSPSLATQLEFLEVQRRIKQKA